MSHRNPTVEAPRDFLLLDALRGVAALAVVQFHTHALFGRAIFPHGYLAVDFFFMLSGFVLTRAYQHKLDSGWSTGSFLKLRLVRLYPLYFLSLAAGFLFRLLQHMTVSTMYSASNLGVFLLLGLFFLPAPPGYQAAGNLMFPYNFPAWSLLYELLGNAIHAVAFRRRSRAFLLLLVALAAALLIGISWKSGTVNLGWAGNQLVPGFPRLLFSYTVGVLLYRTWQKGRPRYRISPLWCAVLLLGVLAAPATASFSLGYDLAIILCVFPAFLFLCASSVPSSRAAAVCRTLGVTSYAVYVLHEPLVQILGTVWTRALHRDMAADAPVSGLIYLGLLLLLAMLVDRIYDLPVRAFLRRKLSSAGDPLPALGRQDVPSRTRPATH